jgi:hypothetical protein
MSTKRMGMALLRAMDRAVRAVGRMVVWVAAAAFSLDGHMHHA